MKLKKFTALCLSAVISLSASAYASEQKSNFPIKKILLYSSPLLVLLPVAVYAAFKLIPSKKVHVQTELKNDTVPTKQTFDLKENKPLSTQKTTQNIQPQNLIRTSQERFDGWIKLLSGETTSNRSFRYKSGGAFRKDTDRHLETYHDFIQVFFPNIEQSNYGNHDLFINNYKDKWKTLLENNPEIFEKIQNEMRLNLVRMLKFWKFEADYSENRLIISLPQSSKSQLNSNFDHNCLRASRVLIALRLFGLNEEHNQLLSILNESYPNHQSLKFWNETKNAPFIKNLLEM